ncbi:MAG: hypothetical protein RXR74_04095 [Nitrososphaeria archaeon]
MASNAPGLNASAASQTTGSRGVPRNLSLDSADASGLTSEQAARLTAPESNSPRVTNPVPHPSSSALLRGPAFPRAPSTHLRRSSESSPGR